MNVRHLTDPAFPVYAGDRRRVGAPVDRRVAALRPVIKATGWILAGAGVGSVALIALLWAITSFTSLKDTSDTWTVVKMDQYPQVR
jgi:hypothetical protein